MLPITHISAYTYTRNPPCCLQSSPATFWSKRPLFESNPTLGSRRGALAALCIAIRHAAVDRSSQRPPCCQPRRAEVALSGDTTRLWEMDAALSAVQQAKSPKERLDAAEAWRVRRLWAQLACSALPPHCTCAERTLWLPRTPTGGFPRRRAERAPGSCGVRRGGGAAARQQRKGGWAGHQGAQRPFCRRALPSALLPAFPPTRREACADVLSALQVADAVVAALHSHVAAGPGGLAKHAPLLLPHLAEPLGDARAPAREATRQLVLLMVTSQARGARQWPPAHCLGSVLQRGTSVLPP